MDSTGFLEGVELTDWPAIHSNCVRRPVLDGHTYEAGVHRDRCRNGVYHR